MTHFGTSWSLWQGSARQWCPLSGNKDTGSKDLKQNLGSSLRNWPSQHGAQGKGRREKSQAATYKIYFHWPPKYGLWLMPCFHNSLPLIFVLSNLKHLFDYRKKQRWAVQDYLHLWHSLQFKSKLSCSFLEDIHLWQVWLPSTLAPLFLLNLVKLGNSSCGLEKQMKNSEGVSTAPYELPVRVASVCLKVNSSILLLKMKHKGNYNNKGI